MIAFFGGLVTGIVICWMGLPLLSRAILRSRAKRLRQAVSYRISRLDAVDYSHS